MDFGIILESAKSNVMDRSKIRGARKRQRNFLQVREKGERRCPAAVYFDGRKDRTVKMERRGTKYYRTTVIEEPFSRYVGHVNPQSGIDGTTTGPKSFCDPIGTLLLTCETLPIVTFDKIDSELPLVDVKDLSSDQKYLLEINQAVISGKVSDDLEKRNPGKLAHARWVTFANRILRLYIATNQPNENLRKLADYVVKVYAHIWFHIKKKYNLCTDGANNLFHFTKLSRYLNENDRKKCRCGDSKKCLFRASRKCTSLYGC